jgi:hypothetical protein
VKPGILLSQLLLDSGVAVILDPDPGRSDGIGAFCEFIFIEGFTK